MGVRVPEHEGLLHRAKELAVTEGGGAMLEIPRVCARVCTCVRARALGAPSGARVAPAALPTLAHLFPVSRRRAMVLHDPWWGWRKDPHLLSTGSRS